VSKKEKKKKKKKRLSSGVVSIPEHAHTQTKIQHPLTSIDRRGTPLQIRAPPHLLRLRGPPERAAQRRRPARLPGRQRGREVLDSGHGHVAARPVLQVIRVFRRRHGPVPLSAPLGVQDSGQAGRAGGDQRQVYQPGQPRGCASGGVGCMMLVVYISNLIAT